MICRWSCLVALVFLVGMIYSTNAVNTSGVLKQYKAQLPPELATRYEKITTERRNIYYQGYALGFLVSLVVIFLNMRMSKRMGGVSVVCIVLAVSFLTNYFYYLLAPKSDWMLNHIKDPNQVKAWLHMYKTMQYYYHSGLALGLVAMAALAFAFRC